MHKNCSFDTWLVLGEARPLTWRVWGCQRRPPWIRFAPYLHQTLRRAFLLLKRRAQTARRTPRQRHKSQSSLSDRDAARSGSLACPDFNHSAVEAAHPARATRNGGRRVRKERWGTKQRAIPPHANARLLHTAPLCTPPKTSLVCLVPQHTLRARVLHVLSGFLCADFFPSPVRVCRSGRCVQSGRPHSG